MPADLANQRVVVMGLGRFGGGIGVARWLCRQGAKVVVTDLAPPEDLQESLKALDGLDLTLRLGEHDDADLDGCDLLVVSPAVNKRTSSFFKAAVARNIAWSSEMTLFLERCPAVVVGVTGSAGKSTTVAMIETILNVARGVSGWRHGRVWLGGNIGKSLLEDLPAMEPQDIVVLELSSFQLEDAAPLRWSPRVALVTNFRENHLDRHGTLAEYAEAKGSIYRYQARHHWLAMPWASGVERLPTGWEDKPRLYRFGVEVETGRARLRCRNGTDYAPETLEIPLKVPGLHNIENAAGALAVARMLGVADAVALPALASFGGLPHRLEFVRACRGVRFYNDSKATSPDATITSLQAFDNPIVVLLGGSDKGGSFDALGESVATRVKVAVCMGETRERIVQAIRRAGGGRAGPRIETADRFDQAVALARAAATDGDVVLLSPACASFDWFVNYEQRGETFKKLVSAWNGGRS